MNNKKIILDLGAHWGESINFFSTFLDDSKSWDLVSVEASELNFKKLELNAKKYLHEFKSITLHNKFVFHKNENIKFYEYIDDFHSAGSTYSKEKFDFNSKKKPAYKNLPHNIIEPSIFNICNEYLNALENYNEIIIKMDIEGAEYEILPSLINILNPLQTKHFFIEFHSKKILNIPSSIDSNYISQIKNLGIEIRELNNL